MLAFVLGVIAWFSWSGFGPRLRRRAIHSKSDKRRASRKKPPWVQEEVIKLKALMPHEGCRTIASAFNARNTRKGETVGKTYVAEVLKRHASRVLKLQRDIKNRRRVQGQRNLVWGMDLTFLTHHCETPVLGIMDHGTRALLCLRPLVDRSTTGLLRVLLDVMEHCGRPRFLRTDNETLFTSRRMRLALLFLGIRKQTIDPFCPWQNGRIKRLFRTLKERLYPWWQSVGVPDDVQVDLDVFKTWYNHARPHQSLASLTPAMAWAARTGHRKCPRFFQAWDGLLTGWTPPP